MTTSDSRRSRGQVFSGLLAASLLAPALAGANIPRVPLHELPARSGPAISEVRLPADADRLVRERISLPRRVEACGSKGSRDADVKWRGDARDAGRKGSHAS